MRIKNKKSIRDLFVGLDEKVYDCEGCCIDGINFDNAATTPPFKSSIDYKGDKQYLCINRKGNRSEG